MKYEVSKNNGQHVISLHGEIDLHFSPELRKVILSELETGQLVLIDLEGVSYLDSSGVACFVEAYQFSKKNKREFYLTNISESVMQVFKLARLDKVFPIKP